MSLGITADVLQASMRLAAPLMLAGTGAVFSERCGVFNIALEGMMLAGALAAAVGSRLTHSAWGGLWLSMLVGGLMGLMHAYLTITRRADQIVTGAAINLLVLGATDMLFARLFTGLRMRMPVFPVLAPESYHSIPLIGPLFLSQPVIVWLACLLPFLASGVLYRTTLGLSIRAVGNNPRAVAAAGLSVYALRYTGVILSGICAGMGGCALALAELGYFAPGMTSGRGFMALAALVVGKWNPIKVGAACLLFGAADAIQLRLQAVSSVVPYQFFVILPYVLTIVVLARFVGRTVPPKALGKSFDPENM